MKATTNREDRELITVHHVTFAQLLLIDRYANKLKGSLSAQIDEMGQVRMSLGMSGKTFNLPPTAELASAWKMFQLSADAALRAFRDGQGLEL